MFPSDQNPLQDVSDKNDTLTKYLAMVMPQLSAGENTPTPGTAPIQDPAQSNPLLQLLTQQGTTDIPRPPALVDPNTVAEQQKRALQTPQDMFEALKRQQFGMTPDQTSPTAKQRLHVMLKEMLKGAVTPYDSYHTPEDEMKEKVKQWFPLETQRLNTLGPLDRMQTAYETLNRQMQMKQDQLDSLNEDRATKNAIAAKKEQDLAAARNKLNEIRSSNYDSLGRLRTAQEKLTDQRTYIATFQAQHPNWTVGELYDELSKGMDPQGKLELMTVLHNPMASSGSSSRSSITDGVQGTDTDRHFIAGTLIPALAGKLGGAAGPAPTSPVTPPFAPAQTASPLGTPGIVRPPTPSALPAPRAAASPATGNPLDPAAGVPQATGTFAMPGAPAGMTPADVLGQVKQGNRDILTDPRIMIPPGIPHQRDTDTKRDAAVVAQRNSLEKMDKFANMVNTGSSNMVNALLSKRASNYQGLLQGNSAMVSLRNMLGTKTNEETLQALTNLEALYTKLGINVRGRFTMPEISGHLATMAQLQQDPSNALRSLTALKLMANAGRMLERGQITSQDAETVNALVRQEMDRVQNAVKTATPQDKARAIANGAPDKKFDVQDLEDLLKQYQASHVNNATLDQLKAERARRAGK